MTMELNQRYDVFVCGRPLRKNNLGRDEDKLKRSMADVLCDVLHKNRIKTFMSVPGFDRGDNTSIYIIKALQVSRMSIVFLTKDFLASPYCLDELVQILERKNTTNHPIYPVYYNVTPSELWQLKNKHMVDYKTRFGLNSGTVQYWDSALVEIMNMPSSTVRSQFTPRPPEDAVNQLIDGIVKWVISYMPNYHVFISFNEDTRYSFSGYLCETLDREGFKTFMKEKGWEDGNQSSKLSIENSRIALIVLSENYAFSRSCLDELVTILDTMKNKNLLVWPVFYKVDPSEIRHQRNNYHRAMAQHENLLGKDSPLVKMWRSALFEVASLKGWHWKNEYEYDFIQKVVERVGKA